jgi:excisionase family DNA binding protein
MTMVQQHPTDSTLLNDEEAAQYLNTTTRHLRRLVTVHGLPHVQLGGKRRFLRDDLDGFVERSRVAG